MQQSRYYGYISALLGADSLKAKGVPETVLADSNPSNG
jgi:hypothetical protein